MFEFWSLDNSSSKSILDVLETIYLKFRKPIVQRVTVIKFGVYNGGGNCFCGVNCEGQGRDGYSGEHECDDSRI